jgi:hypothetical protein
LSVILDEVDGCADELIKEIHHDKTHQKIYWVIGYYSSTRKQCSSNIEDNEEKTKWIQEIPQNTEIATFVSDFKVCLSYRIAER